MKLPCIVIQRCLYSNNHQYSWTFKNKEGGSFGMGGFKTLKSCLASATHDREPLPVYLNEVTWDYDADVAIENITLLKGA